MTTTLENKLTRREKECFHFMVQGYTSRQIAAFMGISEATIDKHRDAVNYKLRVNCAAALIRTALRHGWLTIEEFLACTNGENHTRLNTPINCVRGRMNP